MKLKKYNEFNTEKVNEGTVQSYRDDMADLSEVIKQRGDTAFYLKDSDGHLSKWAITDNMRNGFESFQDGDQVGLGNIKDVAEFIYAFAREMEEHALLEPEAKTLLEELQTMIDSPADTEYLEDFPEFDITPREDVEDVDIDEEIDGIKQ